MGEDVKIQKHRFLAKMAWIGISLGLMAGGMVSAIQIFPGFGAQGAIFLRSIFGNDLVARLEELVLLAQDKADMARYSLGISRPAAPWQAPSSPASDEKEIPSAPRVETTVIPPPPPEPIQKINPTPESTPAVQATLTPTPQPTVTSTPNTWVLAAVPPLGKLEGEGQWSVYLKDRVGRPVAYRTFLQPDAKRPYTLLGVVAFNLERSNLRYVLGSVEPNTYKLQLPGTIPPIDRKAGKLLAVFNGGFMATHGKYGAMSNGIEPLPPRDAVGTVVIYQDGRVAIGEWGKDIHPSQDMVAWRQNCPPIIRAGQIHAKVEKNLIEDWGGTLDGEVVTWRSGLGISKDGKVLYFFAGPRLSMPVMAQAMTLVGVHNAIQLDINSYWVHFSAVKEEKGELIADPLFPEEMKVHKERFLNPSTRDFFYITLKEW